jgi:hypothetical protein
MMRSVIFLVRMGKLYPKLKLRLPTRAKTHPLDIKTTNGCRKVLNLLYEYVASYPIQLITNEVLYDKLYWN